MRETFASIDDLLLSPAYVANPYDVYRELRTHFPAYWCERWNAWLITRYRDVQSVLHDFRRFSNRGRYSEFLAPLAPAERAQLEYLENHYRHGGLVQSDPPAHTRLRKLIASAFTPRIVSEMRNLVRQITHGLIDKFAGSHEIELIRDFAFPLPATVIAGVLGVPASERDQFKQWSSDVQRFLGSGKPTIEYALAAQTAWRSMNEYFAAMLTERRKQPTGDLLSCLGLASEDNEQLTTDEIVRTCGAILIAGHETTTNLISNGLWLLLRHPGQRQLLQRDASLFPTAIEECLRFESPFQSVPRTLTEDVEIAGRQLRKGELVYALLGAANRDEDQFEHADCFDITRRNNSHVAFGYATHFCLGANLARMEGAMALEALLERLPRLALDPERAPAWKRSMVQRGMEHFSLTLG